MTTTISVKEYAQKHGVSVETVRRRIRQGKLQTEFDGHQYRIYDNPQQSATSSPQHLIEKTSNLQVQLETAHAQINDYREQIAELHQLLAISQKNINQITEQNQLLLEDLRPKRRWYHRLLLWNKEVSNGV
jgi:excisionase family DNA binding protein